jgi:disulfide bond formation protein DsbB
MKRAVAAMLKPLGRYGHYVAWTIALLATVISLYLSEGLHLVPCVLCWYTRVLMYPLVAIIGLGIARREQQWVYYAAPLVGAGLLLTTYHALLQWGVIPEAVAPCMNGVSCATRQVNLLGFITIPFLGWLSFAAIAVCLYLYWKETRRVA